MARLVLALDTPDGPTALRLVDQIDGLEWVKVGSILFVREGPDLIARLLERDLKVFLDLKWHDIPHTVGQAVAAARDLGVAMATVHTLGGSEMMTAAAEAAGRELDIVGVTVLTSHTPASFGVATGRPSPDLLQEAIRLASSALAAGLKGVVCSAREARPLRQAIGAAALMVVPGIRRGSDPADDQSRTATPADAVTSGATHLVIGRPILNAADPAGAWKTLMGELP